MHDRRQNIRSTLATLACLALLAGCSKAPVPAPQSPGYTPGKCQDDFSIVANTVDCGTMVVEETRGSGNGRLVTFPVAIVRALNHPKRDPVIFLHGGPGGSGLVGTLATRLKERRVPITEDRDWIFLDQRGAGQSTPSLDCGVLGLSDVGLTSDAAADDAKACGEAFTRQGIDLSQFNTAVIVEDVRDLRKALHITAYNLYGVSYGSRVALGVMRHDPADLRAVVLDSPWPPETDWTTTLPTVVSRELRQVLSLCAADATCNRKHPDMQARLDGLMTQWLQSPPTVHGHAYNAEELVAFLLDALYDDVGARSLPMTIDQVIAGDTSALDAFLVEQSGYVEGQFFTHLCKEEFAFESADAIEGATGDDPVAVAAARAARRYFAACTGYAVGAPDPVENQPVTSDIPTLLLSAQLDAGCPSELAAEAATHLGYGQVFDMPNMTHAVAYRSPCAKRMVAAFLDQPQAPVDASCIASDRPVFPFILEPSKAP